MAEEKSLWARSADPAERKRVTEAREKRKAEAEMRTKNMVHQSAWDKVRGRDGEMKKKR